MSVASTSFLIEFSSLRIVLKLLQSCARIAIAVGRKMRQTGKKGTSYIPRASLNDLKGVFTLSRDNGSYALPDAASSDAASTYAASPDDASPGAASTCAASPDAA